MQAVYTDGKGGEYKVMKRIGIKLWKVKCKRISGHNKVSVWREVEAAPWRGTSTEAEADLARMAEENGWTMQSGLSDYCFSPRCEHVAYTSLASHKGYCAYIEDTGKARGCPAGDGCPRHTKLTGLTVPSRVSHFKQE